MKKLSRREFLQLSALATAGSLLAACAKKPTEAPVEKPAEKNLDFVLYRNLGLQYCVGSAETKGSGPSRAISYVHLVDIRRTQTGTEP